MSRTPAIRPARNEDAPHLVGVIDLASEGMLPMIWSQLAPEGVDPMDVGLGTVAAEDGDFSYRFGRIAELDGAVAGGMISYRLPDTPAPPDPDLPEAFVGVKELADLVPGQWYINMIATLPEHRGRGVARALLEEAEREGRHRGCPGIALIVAASNEDAIGLYEHIGYREVARRPFDLSTFGQEATDALLMTKKLG